MVWTECYAKTFSVEAFCDGRLCAQEIEDDAAEGCPSQRRLGGSVAATAFAEARIRAPVHIVFHAPVAAHGAGKSGDVGQQAARIRQMCAGRGPRKCGTRCRATGRRQKAAQPMLAFQSKVLHVVKAPAAHQQSAHGDHQHFAPGLSASLFDLRIGQLGAGFAEGFRFGLGRFALYGTRPFTLRSHKVHAIRPGYFDPSSLQEELVEVGAKQDSFTNGRCLPFLPPFLSAGLRFGARASRRIGCEIGPRMLPLGQLPGTRKA